jgi:hypothetical protein
MGDEHGGARVMRSSRLERRVPRFASPLLEIRARRDVDDPPIEARTQASCDLCNNVAIASAAGAEPMVDVHGDRLEAGVDGERQERNGIGAAGTTDDHWCHGTS